MLSLCNVGFPWFLFYTLPPSLVILLFWVSSSGAHSLQCCAHLICGEAGVLEGRRWAKSGGALGHRGDDVKDWSPWL